MRKIITLALMTILTAAMARGQILAGSALSIPSSGLPSVVTITHYCEHGYDETITLVPAGDNGIIAFFSVSDDSVRLGQGRLQGGDGTMPYTGGPINGHPNVYWVQCPPFPDERNAYSFAVELYDRDRYAGYIAININVYPEGMTEDNSTTNGCFGCPDEFEYKTPFPIFGPDVIRYGHNWDFYLAGEYIPEKLRGTRKRTDRTPYEYANLRRFHEAFPVSEYERAKQYKDNEDKD